MTREDDVNVEYLLSYTRVEYSYLACNDDDDALQRPSLFSAVARCPASVFVLDLRLSDVEFTLYTVFLPDAEWSTRLTKVSVFVILLPLVSLWCAMASKLSSLSSWLQLAFQPL